MLKAPPSFDAWLAALQAADRRRAHARRAAEADAAAAAAERAQRAEVASARRGAATAPTGSQAGGAAPRGRSQKVEVVVVVAGEAANQEANRRPASAQTAEARAKWLERKAKERKQDLAGRAAREAEQARQAAARREMKWVFATPALAYARLSVHK